MKNDIFGAWLKELCSLIFVQTFQAFLLAIVMSVIVKILASSSSAAMEGGLDAVGILAIFALASFSKIELLIKNIFGLTSGVGDPSLANGHKSFMGSMLAIKGLGRTLNNGGKMIGGAGKALGGQFRMWKAKKDVLDGELGKTGLNEKTPRDLPPSPSIGGVASTGGAITRLSEEMANLTSALKEQAGKTEEKGKDDKRKALNDAIANAKKERNEGLKTMFSGAAETVGALHGAVAGGVYGLSRGDKIGESMAVGAGTGDYVGEKIVSGASAVPGALKTAKSGINAAIKLNVGNSGRAYKELEKEIKNSQKSELSELNKKLDMYAKSKGVYKEPSSKPGKPSIKTKTSLDDQ